MNVLLMFSGNQFSGNHSFETGLLLLCMISNNFIGLFNIAAPKRRQGKPSTT